MLKKRFPVYYEGTKMRWATGTAVWGAPGYCFLSGTEGQKGPESIIEEGMKEQTRLSLEKMKERLEDFGTTLDNICHLWYYIVGSDFPNGVAPDPKFVEAAGAIDEFWAKYCPDFCWKENPPPSTLVGVSGLGARGQLIEIMCIAAVPPLEG
ncbi:RidA family protein [Chloroflexota bacterium]